MLETGINKEHIYTHAMQNEMVLQKLNELREVVDGNVADMVDTMATLVILRQDISNPMFGAQVTVYEKPEGTWVEVDEEEYKSADNNAKSWMWRRMNVSNGKDTSYQKYQAYTEKQKIHRSEVPEPLDPNQPLEDDIKAANSLTGEWTIYEADFREYRVRDLIDPELQSRNAIVYDPMVAELPADIELWDPHRQEYTTSDDYPMGTVNVIVSEQGEFGTDYTYGVRELTSVTPCKDSPKPLTYTPGWS